METRFHYVQTQIQIQKNFARETSPPAEGTCNHHEKTETIINNNQ